jgi:hypothetical protein
MVKKYNFAFFGLSGSGKTCILAALDMQRVEHPAGYTCSLLPVDVRRPSGDPEEWTEAAKEADILHKSINRIEEAKQKLEQGSVPMGTELSIDFMFNYKFSSYQTSDFYVKLIDYGGELVNPQNAPQEIAKELRDKLANMDGILILAPVPIPEKSQKDLSEKLNQLQKTMGLIHFSKPVPIALLITKWDRVASLSDYSFTQKPFTKEDMPTTEHRDLYNDLVNKVGQGNCKAFPVSAFGECKRRTTIYKGKEIEVPKQINPLASYGLLDGFIWLAQRLNEFQLQKETKELQNHLLDLQNYEQALANHQKWQPYPSLALWKLKRQGKKIIKLFPDDLEMASQAQKAWHQSRKIWWSRILVLPPLIVMLFLLGFWSEQTYQDKKSYDEVHRTLHDPTATFEDILKAEKWLEQYYYTTLFAHPLSWLFVISNGNAKFELDQSRERREQQLWQAVVQAESLQDKYQAAHHYQQQFGHGHYQIEINKIIAQFETEMQDKWLAFQSDYYESFNHGEFMVAAQQLSNYPLQKEPQLQRLIAHFNQNVFDLLTRKINEFIRHQNWADAYDKLNTYYEWPEIFKNQQDDQNIQALRETVQKAEARYLYLEFLEAKDIERAENYLEHAPGRFMKDKVKAYKDYLLQIKNPLKLVLILERIEWGNFSDDDNIVIVSLDGKKIIEKVDINAETNSSSALIGHYELTKKRLDFVKLEVKIITETWFSGYDNNGEGSITTQVKDLNGLAFYLIPPNEHFKNKAVFRLEGIPEEPHLPYWEN